MSWRGEPGEPGPPGCPFCWPYQGPSRIVRDFGPAYVIEPKYPVVPGHLLVIPKVHFEHASHDPMSYSILMHHAARMTAEFDCNIIQNNGRSATQTVPHVHVHLVPRTRHDDMCLPWDCRTEFELPDDTSALMRDDILERF